jgi:hypothetical protein
MNADEIVRALRENAEWCDANEYEVPICMGDNQRGAADLIESLQAQLAESQRRERAAVKDLNGPGACFTCKHFRRNGGDCFGAGRCRLDGIEIWPCNQPGVYRVEVPDDGRQTYEWRGPMAGEGEAE